MDAGALLQTIVTSALTAIAALGLAPAVLGDKLLGHLLERKLSALQHDQNEKIEALRAQFAHLSDRGQRSNEREFNALSGVWDKFVEAYLATYNCIASYMEFPDLDHLHPEELAVFLGQTELSETQKQQVVSSKTKTDIFAKIMTLRRIGKAAGAIFDTRLLLRKNGIFIPEELSKRLEAALQVFSKAQIERHMEFRHPKNFDGKESMFFVQNGERLVDEVKAEVRKRLLREL